MPLFVHFLVNQKPTTSPPAMLLWRMKNHAVARKVLNVNADWTLNYRVLMLKTVALKEMMDLCLTRITLRRGGAKFRLAVFCYAS